LGSPVIDGWRRIDRRCRQRAAAADQWWRGRRRSNSGEDRGRAGQRVARVASQGPRERTEAVGWLGDRAGSRARRRLPGCGRGRNHSGELAARADQQARVGATGGPSGVRSSTCWRGKAGGGGVHREASMADGGSSVLARGRIGRLYSRARGGWGGFLAHQGNQVMEWSVAWPEYGAKGRRRHAACTSSRCWLGGAARVRQHCGPWMRGTWRQGRGQEWRFHGAWTGGSATASAFGPGGKGVVSARDAARRRAVRRSGSKPFQLPYFELNFLKFSKQNCTKV
jgi:hypothetical protein